MALIYRFFIGLYGLGLWLARPFSDKARRWWRGRQNWRALLAQHLPQGEARPRLWMHCASLGEFEQGREVLRLFRAQHPEYFVLVTFFSPSGYEARRNTPLADFVAYLPLDTRANARDFVELVSPEVVIFVRYEFWYYYLNMLYLRGIKLYLIGAVFGPSDIFFSRWWGGLHRRMLKFFTNIYCQDALSRDLLWGIGLHSEITGEPRIDAILADSERPAALPSWLRDWAAAVPVFICGSVYSYELPFLEYLTKRLLASGWRVLLVPHECNAANIANFEARFKAAGVAVYTRVTGESPNLPPIVLVNTVGLLKSLYGLGPAAYIGGGLLGGNLHNVAEAAVAGCLTFFGSSRRRFVETELLLREQLAILLPACRERRGQEEAAEFLCAQLAQAIDFERLRLALKAFFERTRGASQRILASIEASK